MIQLTDVEKSIWVWYKDGLMTIYKSNYLSYFIGYELNNEFTQR